MSNDITELEKRKLICNSCGQYLCNKCFIQKDVDYSDWIDDPLSRCPVGKWEPIGSRKEEPGEG